jgi:hypothetical protein
VCFILSIVILVLVCFKYQGGQGPEYRPYHPNDPEAGLATAASMKNAQGYEYNTPHYVENGKKRILLPLPDDEENHQPNQKVFVTYLVGMVEQTNNNDDYEPDGLHVVTVSPRRASLGATLLTSAPILRQIPHPVPSLPAIPPFIPHPVPSLPDIPQFITHPVPSLAAIPAFNQHPPPTKPKKKTNKIHKAWKQAKKFVTQHLKFPKKKRSNSILPVTSY